MNLEEAGFEGNMENEDDELIRKELLEFLVRIMVNGYYIKSGRQRTITELFNSMRNFLDEICKHITPNYFNFKRQFLNDNEANNKFYINKII